MISRAGTKYNVPLINSLVIVRRTQYGMTAQAERSKWLGWNQRRLVS